jgi:hypothetical protein
MARRKARRHPVPRGGLNREARQKVADVAEKVAEKAEPKKQAAPVEKKSGSKT